MADPGLARRLIILANFSRKLHDNEKIELARWEWGDSHLGSWLSKMFWLYYLEIKTCFKNLPSSAGLELHDERDFHVENDHPAFLLWVHTMVEANGNVLFEKNSIYII